MAVTLFTDLNCPFCYATEQRLEHLGVSDRISWRGVEHEPELPVPMALDDVEIAAELAEEVQSVRARAPEVAIAVPPGKANTAAGLLATAAALRVDAVRGADFRRAVYRAFWRDGRDVSDPAVLEVACGDLREPPVVLDQQHVDGRAVSRLHPGTLAARMRQSVKKCCKRAVSRDTPVWSWRLRADMMRRPP